MTLKIYTKVGDQGKTKQVSGKMVPKYDLQIETLGNLDELQSYLGVTIANLSDNCQVLKDELQKRQKNWKVELIRLHSNILGFQLLSFLVVHPPLPICSIAVHWHGALNDHQLN